MTKKSLALYINSVRSGHPIPTPQTGGSFAALPARAALFVGVQRQV